MTRALALGLLIAAVVAPAAPARAIVRDPVDHTQSAAPDGTPVCAAWVHERHTVRVRGRRWPTWHPPADARYHCAFGHEHGTNPRAFRFFRKAARIRPARVGRVRAESHVGMPAFGRNGDRVRRGRSLCLEPPLQSRKANSLLCPDTSTVRPL